MIKTRKSEHGQSMLFFAILMPIMALFLLGILDYMVTNARIMETVAVADLAAHAGAQEITVLPNGVVTATTRGNRIAAKFPYKNDVNKIICHRHKRNGNNR